VRGGGGNDVIDGESGADRLYGDNGDDRIVYDAGDYVIDGGQGTDTLVLKGAAEVWLDRFSTSQVDRGAYVTGFENVDASASAKSVKLTGSQHANNVLTGGSGRDVLTGGLGADQFVFKTAPRGGAADTITDFSPEDRILLDRTVFHGLSAGKLAVDMLEIGSVAADSRDRIIYDQETGSVYFDQDGSGAGHAPVEFAVMGTFLEITAQNFIVF